MPFYFYNDQRLGRLVEELEELRYRNMKDIPFFLFYKDESGLVTGKKKGNPTKIGKGFRWRGWDRYHWLCATVRIPEKVKGRKTLGLFDFKAPVGTGNNSHFESLLYVDKEAYQGVDGNHKEVFFPFSGDEKELEFRVWSGLSGGGIPEEMEMEIIRAQIGYLDENVNALYFLSRNMLETYHLLDENHPDKEWMLNLLNRGFQKIDFTNTQTDRFCEAAGNSYAWLSEQLEGRKVSDVQMTMVGHTHIDVGWLWQIKHTREKAARSFSTVNRLMEQYEEYQFMQSQAQLYAFMKEDFPDIYEKMKQRIKEGRWEPAGAMWVECDCNLVSGESLVRQILMGKGFFAREFGVDNKYLWLPDVFGYSWAMPQILKKCGIHTFVTSKISWNDTNKMPYDTFLWRGMDGSEIVAHFITTPDPEASSYTYNGDTKPYAVKGTWDNYSNKDLNTELLIPFGYGDGGGGVNMDMLETLQCIPKMPGIPHIKKETAADYFDGLQRTLTENKRGGYLPVWDGELYLEFHRGTYTSQAYNKRMNRKMEYLLRDAEILSVLAREQKGMRYQKQMLDKIWKEVLCLQFHDILPGSSIKEVYDDSRKMYEEAREHIEGILDSIYDAFSNEQKGSWFFFQGANWKRSSYVCLEGVKEELNYRTRDGKKLPSAAIDGETYVYLEDMEPFSFVTIETVGEKQEPLKEKKLFTDHASTTFYKVAWNEKGQLTSIFDKEAKRELLMRDSCGNVLQVFEDIPRCFDAWEIESTMHQKMELIDRCVSIEPKENELGTFITFIWEYEASRIRQTLCLYTHNRRIDFKTKVDWKEQKKLLKVAFPVNIRAVDARFDIQYGNIRRPITKNTSWEAAKFEVVAHKWMDLWETGYGVALLNDCKYGHDIDGNVMRITLIKCAVDPDYAADLGAHIFTYSLLPHTQEWYTAGIEQQGYDLNNPLFGRPGADNAAFGSMMELKGTNSFKRHAYVDCVKMEEGHSMEKGEGIMIRLHEYAGGREQIEIRTVLNYVSWQECDLLEHPIEEPRTDPICLNLTPYEIKTIKLIPGKSISQSESDAEMEE